MATAWFVCEYRRQTGGRPGIRRVPAFDDLMELVNADGGQAAWAEILGQRCVAKVRASAETLALIAAEPDVVRLPAAALSSPLSSLTAGQRAAVRQLALDCGYNAGEWGAAFPGGVASATLGDVLRLLASRRRKVRYDEATDTILDDGEVLPVRSLRALDLEVA